MEGETSAASVAVPLVNVKSATVWEVELLVVLPSDTISEDESRAARAMSNRGIRGLPIVWRAEQELPGGEGPPAEQMLVRLPVLVVVLRGAAAKDLHLHDPDSFSDDEMLLVWADSLDRGGFLVAGLLAGIADFLAATLASIFASTDAVSGEFISVHQCLAVLERRGPPAAQALAGGIQLLRPPAA